MNIGERERKAQGRRKERDEKVFLGKLSKAIESDFILIIKFILQDLFLFWNYKISSKRDYCKLGKGCLKS